ncbi:MAG: hypothetical protein NTU57_05105 [Candidatus Aenigmarchaeota archaeon]|nr:hypothetical protein [Candidatus Aenigmarchaeota archaeon]
MKAKILLILAIISLILIDFSGFVFAESNCQIAVPRFGVVECKNTGQKQTLTGKFEYRDGWYYAQNTVCLSNCEIIANSNIHLSGCTGSVYSWEIWKKANGVANWTEIAWPYHNDNVQINWNRDDLLSIRTKCSIGGQLNIESSYVEFQQDLIKLYEGWGGSLPTKPIDGTEGCSLNTIVDQYRETLNLNSWVNPSTGSIENNPYPTSTYSSTNVMPTNWRISDNYVFVKDWETGIADISLTYDKNNNAFWCGGNIGSRKIYNVQEITAVTGQCYSIPTSIKYSSIECCFPADCSFKGTTYTCNPDTWKCEETRWCDSDLDCQQVFGEGVCKNKQITKWSCNINKKWGSHQGTCEKNIRSVLQCPEDCTTSEYYNEIEGQCKSLNILLNCPTGSCCEEGGDYKIEPCSSGLKCCHPTNPIVGECKISCGAESQIVERTAGLENVDYDKSSTSNYQAINQLFPFFVLMIIILAGPIIYYLNSRGYISFLIKSKTNTGKPKHLERKIRKDKVEKSGNGFCQYCGNKLENSDAFCPECGRKV